jgi:UDP-GlcNAc3NAcA epimerase
MALVSRSRLLITDSGGLQKEAYLLNTPCLTVRDNTEWVETIEKGANVLAQAAADDIATKAAKMWNLELNNDPSVYGNGKASEKIARILISGEIETHRNVMTK